MEEFGFLQKVAHNFWPQLMIVAVLYIVVILAIFFDLLAGIRKAKQRGEFRSSFGFRKTIDKIGKYFNMLLAVTATDVIQILAVLQLNAQTDMILPVMPLLTFIGATFACFIEIKSIYEKNSDKDRAKVQEAAKLMTQLIHHKDNQEMFASFIDYVKTQKKDESSQSSY
jgi:hypothetical protein